jgi:hypothetical protein
MRRIRFIRAVRPFMSNLALALALLGVSLYFLGREVFVAQVFRNLAGIYDPVAALRFFETAFLNTELAVQLLSVCALLGFAWLMRESLKALSTMGYSAA